MQQRTLGLAVKRAFDVVASSSVLLLLSPVIGGAAIAILVTMGRPVLFRQMRPGKHEVPFKILKLRTMAHRDAQLRTDEARLTAIGRFLRVTSIDELPQLWNVLKGEMSLVGPRPLLMEYLPLYTAEQRRRHDVLPGVTGWAQVNGRNALTHDERFALDVWYVDNWSLGLDAKIILLTLLRVFERKGVSARGHATMPLYNGSSTQAVGDHP